MTPWSSWRKTNPAARAVPVLVCIAGLLALVFTWNGYGERYAGAAEAWRIGGTRLVQITVVAADRDRLACSSALRFDGMRCGFDKPNVPHSSGSRSRETELQPLNTVEHQLFLAAGLWSSPAMQGPLPKERFTVFCNLHVVGGVKSAALRWSENGPFEPLAIPVPVGMLSDCELPR